jgi:hypothetical protein
MQLRGNGQDRTGSQNKTVTARIGQPEQNSLNKTARTGQAEQDR